MVDNAGKQGLWYWLLRALGGLKRLPGMRRGCGVGRGNAVHYVWSWVLLWWWQWVHDVHSVPGDDVCAVCVQSHVWHG